MMYRDCMTKELIAVVALVFAAGFVLGNYYSLSMTGAVIGTQTQLNLKYSLPENALTVSPDQQSASIGGTVTEDLYINTAKPVYAIELDVVFDPNILEVVSAEPVNVVGAESNPIVKVEDGRITYADTAAGATEGFSGAAKLLSIRFSAKKTGNSQITLEKITLLDSRMQIISGVNPGKASIAVR